MGKKEKSVFKAERLTRIFILVLIFLMYRSVYTQISPDWHAYYNGRNNSNSEANAIAIDYDGNVYVTGMSDDTLWYTPIVTIKYSPSGSQQWARQYPPTNSQYESAGNAIVTYTDGEGRVYIYVAGRLNNPYYQKFVTIMYDEDGVLQWAQEYEPNGNGNNIAYDIKVDAEGSAYVTGEKWNGSNYDYVTIKYEFDGDSLWSATYSGGFGDDIASSLALAGGYVFVTGKSLGNGTGNDFATISYNCSTGAQVWVSRYTSGGNNEDDAEDIAADIYQGVYVTGTSGSPNKFTVIKYANDTGGTPFWIKNSENGAGHSIDLYKDPCGGNQYCYTVNVFATGINSGSGLTVGYDEDGNTLSGWPQTESSSTFHALDVDSYGNVYVTGNSGINYLTVKYAVTGGTEEWYAIFPDTTEPSSALGIVVDDNGNAYVTGRHYVGEPYMMSALYLTLKYSSGGDNLVLNGNNTLNFNPKYYSLLQNYPNPFNPSTDIKFELPQNTFVTVKIYNSIGEEVALLVNNEWKSTGRYSIKFDGSNLASGIYFYSIDAGTFRDTKKMVLIK